MTAEPILFHVNLLLVSCVALPLFYAIRSDRYKRDLLTLVGLYLLFLAAPHLILFWIPYWVFVWAANRVLDRVTDDRIRGVAFWSTLVIALAPMVGWKTLDLLFLQALNGPLRHMFESVVPSYRSAGFESDRLVPLGLSFSTFRAIDLLVCRYLEVVPRQALKGVMFFGFFPPVQLMGPITQSTELLETAGGRRVVPDSAVTENLFYGAGRVVVGFAKIYVLALPLAGSGDVLADYRATSIPELWFYLFLHAWYFYLNFAGFSDLAIGIARLYGYRIAENFSFPYFQRNLQQFWAHWHMSLTGFAQRYVFVPLGGFRRHRQYLATFATMMVIALFHDLSLRLVVFGTIHAVVLMGLRFMQIQQSPLSAWRMPAPLAILITHVFVVVTVPLISMHRIDILNFYVRLLSFGLFG